MDGRGVFGDGGGFDCGIGGRSVGACVVTFAGGHGGVESAGVGVTAAPGGRFVCIEAKIGTGAAFEGLGA